MVPSWQNHELKLAYTACIQKKLRHLEDLWIWETDEHELAMRALREQLEDMACYFSVSHVTQDQFSITWGRGKGYRRILMDDIGCMNVVERWKAGEFDNE